MVEAEQRTAAVPTSPSSLPAPLAPPDCDLRGFDWMPLHGHRLFTSDFYADALRNPRGGLAAHRLWWVAWQQCPAGSLPNNEHALARLADFGGDLRGWRRARVVALHGFVLCADGRLYHRALCDHALDAWELRKKAAAKKRNQRDRQRERDQANRQPTSSQDDAERSPNGCQPAADRHLGSEPNTLKNNETCSDVPRDVPAEKIGQDKTRYKKEESDGAASAHAREADPSPGLPLGPVVVAAEVVQIIAAFDAARTAAFPDAEPRFPSQTDRIDAGRWLKAGMDAGMTSVEVVQLCGDVFTAVHTKLASRRSRVPRSLAFHDQDLADAFARKSQSMPAGHVANHTTKGSPNEQHRPFSGAPAGERRRYGESDPETRRRAILAALAPELDMGERGDIASAV